MISHDSLRLARVSALQGFHKSRMLLQRFRNAAWDVRGNRPDATCLGTDVAQEDQQTAISNSSCYDVMKPPQGVAAANLITIA
jgi:hypothetical protein